MILSTSRSWRNWLLVVVALLCLLLLFVGGPQRYFQRSHESLWGLGHVLCFAVWSILFLKWKSGWSFVRQFVMVMVLTLVLGVGIEVIQVRIGRNFDLGDILNNMTGSFLVLAFFNTVRHGLSRARLLLLQVFALLFLGIALFPLGRALFYEQLATSQFPLLADFEAAAELDRWEGNADLSVSRDFVSHGDFSLKVDLNTDRYSGTFLRYFPEDWRNFKVLTFDLYNPSEEDLRLTCRVHDRFHADSGNAYTDRFNRTFSIPPGWTQIDLSLEQIADAPKDRLLDLEYVAGMGLFVTEQNEPKAFYLDHVRLRQ